VLKKSKTVKVVARADTLTAPEAWCKAIRRMHVALTRAKSRILVFSSLLPDDIDLRTASGAQVIVRCPKPFQGRL